MNNPLWQARANAIDNLYMFKFRTKRCTRKNWCKDPSRCFDAHSNLMKRRVPKQVWSKGGLFNYIPEPCPEWQRSKTCSLEDSCTRSHGWLEMIYHPLLYKTKLCQSKRHNGVCIEYGIYCAKAHARSEIRCLDNIYGENWKHHYDLLDSLMFKRNNRPTRDNNIITNMSGPFHGRVGIATPPRRQHVTDLNLFAHYLLDSKISPRDQPPVCVLDRSEVRKIFTKPRTPFKDLRNCFDMRRGSDRNNVTDDEEDSKNYNQLYYFNFGFNNERGHQDSDDDSLTGVRTGRQSTKIRSATSSCNMLYSLAIVVKNECA